MANTIRPLTTEDESFLWEMLYQAIYIPEGQSALPREAVRFYKRFGFEVVSQQDNSLTMKRPLQ
ncbi:MAG: hypothetical protein AAGI69_11160 [Cyanobacteria bacterium P01_H01_bin.21]